MAKINKITLDGLEYEIEDSKAQEKLIELESSVTELITEIFWSDLKNLRDNSELVPGMKYRITDYVTTTSQENTVSANHPFDIIVEALNENTLSENAKACLRNGDTYFKDSNLEAWEIKYCLDNDTSRFAWANDSSVGENTFNIPFLPEYYIYVDEAGNNSDYNSFKDDDYFVEYDYATTPDGLENQLCIFKNDLSNPDYLPGGNEEGTDYSDQFFYWGTEEVDGVTYDKWRKAEESEWYFVEDGNGVYILTKQVTVGTFQEDTHDSSSVSINSDLVGESINKGVIYYMKDEHNNECPYDFKNIQFIRYELSAPTVGGYSEKWQNRMSENISNMFQDNQLSCLWHGVSGEDDYYWEDDMGDVISSLTGEKKAFFTFSNVIDGVVTDKSKTSNCYSNIIKEYYQGGDLLALNNIVFFLTSVNSSCNSNSFGNDCYSNSFGNDCYFNSFGDNCSNNSFGNNCYFNSFGDGCYFNIGINCSSNSFGINCSSNSFGDGCSSNSFGNDCEYNGLGNDCSSNSFGNDCNYNSFNNDFKYNSFGNYCEYNSFGINCSSNSFGSNCTSNSFGKGCEYNSLGNYCYSNSFGSNCTSNSFGNNCGYNSFGNNCRYNSFGNSCKSNSFGINCSSNSFGNGCSSNSFGIYCSSNSFGNDCYSNSIDNNCYSNSFGKGCEYNSLGNYCYSNSFGNNCRYNSLGNDCSYNSFGNDCYSNGFFDGGSYVFDDNMGEYLCEDAPLDYVQNNKFGDGCNHLLIYNDGEVGPDESIQNLNIAQGFSSISIDTANGVFYPEVIKIDTVGQDYEIKIARNSKGEVKIYCEADLIG